MSIEILGVLLHRNASETAPNEDVVFDRAMVRQLATAFDANDFDRVLILQNSFAPDPFAIANYAAAITERLAFMVAHRPGFIAPTMAARMFATLDHLSNGRAGVHIITGANDVELQCDGDFSTKDERYLRSREYVQIMRSIWTSEYPVDHDGKYYRFVNSRSSLHPVRSTGIPVYWGGSSDLALETGGECADVFALGGLKPLEAMRGTVAEVTASAAKANRTIRVQTSARVILGNTEAEALANARDIADKLQEIGAEQQRRLSQNADATMGGMRLDKNISTAKGGSGRSDLDALSDGPEWLGNRLWTGTTRATRNYSTITVPPALVGTAEQVSDALLEYYRLGISGFLIRGFDLLGDIAEHGRELIPRLRAGARRIDEERAAD